MTAATVTVQHAAGAADAQAALDAWLQSGPPAPRAVIAEGLQPLQVPDQVALSQLASGCVCCIGQLPLKVTLLRMLRSIHPRSLLLLVARADHLPRVRTLVADGTLGVKLNVV